MLTPWPLLHSMNQGTTGATGRQPNHVCEKLYFLLKTLFSLNEKCANAQCEKKWCDSLTTHTLR
jgi:hypothetical protein